VSGFHRLLGRRTARCSLARGVVGGDSRARCARVDRDEVSESATDEASDEQSDWAEREWDHATDACAFVAKSARVAAIKDMRSGDW